MTVSDISAICLSLPHTDEEIKWKSDLVYMIARKMFCLVDLEALPTTVAFKVPDDVFEEICAQPNFKPAPYFAQHKWVTVTDIEKISRSELRQHIKTSYGLVKARLTKKRLSELDDGDDIGK